MIVVLAGLPGTGKSTLARELGGVVLNKDDLRAALFPAALVEYSTEQDDFVQELMERTAEYLLTRSPGLTVFFDGRTFSRRYQIGRVIRLAERLRTPWRIIECVCTEKAARERIERGKKHPAKNRTVDLYLKIREEFEPIEHPKLVVDTGEARDLSAVRRFLAEGC